MVTINLSAPRLFPIGTKNPSESALKAALIAMTMMESELSDVYAAAFKGYARGRLKDNHDG